MDADTRIGGPHTHFPTTQSSLLEAAAQGLTSAALQSVMALYWKPVYRFIRLKFRKNNEDAKDLTQDFFTTTLERDFFARFDPGKATFRTYLRMAVERFAANQHAASMRQRRGGGVEFEPVEDLAALTQSPEQIFEREWQRQLFVLAVNDLDEHCNASGKQLHFRIFEAYDLAVDQDERPTYASLAVRHGIAESAVTNHLAWARRALRGFVTSRLRGVTSGERELRREIRRIWT